MGHADNWPVADLLADPRYLVERAALGLALIGVMITLADRQVTFVAPGRAEFAVLVAEGRARSRHRDARNSRRTFTKWCANAIGSPVLDILLDQLQYRAVGKFRTIRARLANMVTERQVHSDELRRKSRDLLNEVEHGGAHVTILRYDTPAAVMVPVGWYRRMLAVKRGVLAFMRDSDTCHQLPGDSELPVGELLAAIGEVGLSVLDEEPDLP